MLYDAVALVSDDGYPAQVVGQNADVVLASAVVQDAVHEKYEAQKVVLQRLVYAMPQMVQEHLVPTMPHVANVAKAERLILHWRQKGCLLNQGPMEFLVSWVRSQRRSHSLVNLAVMVSQGCQCSLRGCCFLVVAACRICYRKGNHWGGSLHSIGKT